MMDSPNPAPRHLAGRGLSRCAAVAMIVSVAGSSGALAQPLTERVEHAVELPHDALITIMNFAGHVEVHGTDPGEDRTLRVVGVKRLETELPEEEAARIFRRVNLDLRRRGRRIHIGPNRPRGDRGRPTRPIRSTDQSEGDVPITEVRAPRRIPPVSVDLEVWLPDGAALEVRTFTAAITVTDIAGPEADFLLRSVSGPLDLRDLEVHDLQAETVSGDLMLANIRSHRATFKTLTAAIRLNGHLHSDGWYEFETHSGAVLLGLGSLSGFNVAASSYAGAIRNDLEFEAHREDRLLEGRHGSEGPQISVNTFSGPIHLAPEAHAEAAPEEKR